MNGELKRVCLYLRVSTGGQTTDNQEIELRDLCERRNFHVVKIYRETVSGSKRNEDRPEFTRMINDLKKRHFEKVVVWSIDRLGRDMKELVRTLTVLDDYDVSLFSWKQNLDTDDSMSRMFFYFVSIFSEFETNIRKERQKVGIQRVRDLGKRYGGNSFISDEQKDRILELRDSGLSYRKISKEVGVGLGSVSRIIGGTV